MEDKEPSIHDLLLKAEEARKNKDNPIATGLYNENLRIDPLRTPAYNALMKIFRKEKAYKKELKIINTAIKVYEKYYNDNSGKHSKQVKMISEKLNKSFGFVDKKGAKLYQRAVVGVPPVHVQPAHATI